MISFWHQIPLVFNNGCASAYICNGSTDHNMRFIWTRVAIHDNAWSSTLYKSNYPYQYRAGGSFAFNMPSNHVISNGDVGVQRPALDYIYQTS